MGDSSSDAVSFEDALARLEEVVRDLEDGEVGLEESLKRYEEGVRLIQRCQAQLQQAEQKILLLTELNEDGRPNLQPFDHEATAPARKKKSKGRPASEQDGLPF